MGVEFPEMRQRLISLLHDADDLDAASFDDWFNDLDWLAPQDISQSIGVTLTGEHEAEAVAAVRERLDAIFADLGDAGFDAYRSDPRWSDVREAARHALAVIEPS
jgi:hypothetical protein